MVISLTDLRIRPVPSSAQANARRAGYRTDVTIDQGAPLAREPCIDVRQLGISGLNHYHSAFNPPYYVSVPGSIEELYLRSSVAAKLVAVNARLAEAGLELFVFDAWRPQAVQRFFHDEWFPRWLRVHRPELEGPRLIEEVERYWAAPSDGPGSPSPHSTGAAVDVTLMSRQTRQHLFMGGLFDDVTEGSWTDAFEQEPVVSMSDAEALTNRRILFWVMKEAGFENNPTEWWHYSWGDQMWAKLSGAGSALYGGCEPVVNAASGHSVA